MYSKCGALADAREVFDKAPCFDLALVNALMLGYADNGDGASALGIFESLPREPDSRSFVAAIAACSALAEAEEGVEVGSGEVLKLGSLRTGLMIHSRAANRAMDTDIFVGNCLVAMYSRCGSLLDARRVFDRMILHDSVSWNSLILGCVDNRECELALELFSAADGIGWRPDSRTWVAVFKACGSLAKKEPGVKVCGRVLKAASLRRGSALHSQAAGAGATSNIFVGNSLIDMYSRCGSMADSEKVFGGMEKRNAVSWTSMMMGYVEAGEPESALRLYSGMSCQPDARSFAAALIACGALAALETGRGVHQELVSRGFGGDSFLSNCLVDLYSKCGSMEDAEEVFGSIRTKTLITWTALLTGYSHLGDTEKVFRTFDKMREAGFQPNGVTLLSLLTACSHAGLVETGKEYFDSMVPKFGVRPEIEHFHCMIDLLGRANLLDRALEIVEAMPFRADEVTWKTVLASSRKSRNVGAGKLAFEALLRIDERDSTAYMLMADLYARAGMWEEQLEVLAMKRKAGAHKKAGTSWWTDSSGKVHSFRAGDLRKLSGLGEFESVLQRAKAEGGYVVDATSLVHHVGEAEKEDALCGHSEKLAIVYALMNSEKRAGDDGRSGVIRIAKNLRVCEDCHAFTAAVSRVERCVIVCRDSSRFHVFQDGGCSCGDFW